MMNEPDNNVEETPERPYRTEDNQYVEEIVNFNDLDEATAMNDDCTDPEAGCSSKKPNKSGVSRCSRNNFENQHVVKVCTTDSDVLSTGISEDEDVEEEGNEEEVIDEAAETIMSELPVANSTELMSPPDTLYILDEDQLENVSGGERRVSFPSPEKLAVYQEPKEHDFSLSEILTSDEILDKYKVSCQKNKTVQLENIVEQLRDVKLNINRSAILKLNMNITVEVCETLEDIFRVSNFRKIILNHCTFAGDTAFEFINMMEYYEPTTELEVTTDLSDYDLWKAFCGMIRRSQYLESIIFINMNIDETFMRHLIFALNNNPKVINLQFKACTLTKAPNFYLVEPLLMNNTLRELHLDHVGLYTRESDSLSRLLSRNSYLKVLNLSNNSIGDRGFEVLARGLFTRTPDMGVCTLILCNNQITERSAATVASIIRDNKNLRLINLGHNPLTDRVLETIEPALGGDTVLEALGLQSTLITDTGAQCLARGLEENTSLRRLNLKGNKAIQVDGVEALCNALTRCRVTKVEIDETNRTCHDQGRYDEIVRQLRGLCSVNEKNCKGEVPNSVSAKIARRVSLDCEPCHSPQPPYLQTEHAGQPNVQLGRPTTTSRFQVSRVRDPAPSSPRFNVVRVSMPVEPSIPTPSTLPVDEEGMMSRFQNLRNSISSSTDSIESLTVQGIDDSVLSPIEGAATD